MSIEDLDHLGEIGERAGQPVDLVDDDDVDPPGLDVGKQALQRRALQGGARDAAIVVTGGQRDPPLVLLAGDIGGAGLPLGLQRVEGLLEAFFRGFTGIDGAAYRGGSLRSWWFPAFTHGPPPLPPLRDGRLKAADRKSADPTSGHR